MSIHDKAATLRSLYEAPEIVRLVNVWDAISATVIADLPGTQAIATAGHSVAASFGYADGELPMELALSGVKTIVDAVDLPVTADLDDGYDDPGETIRRAIGLGVVGANVEDRMRPFEESVERVRSIIRAAQAEGVDFQLNARTDAIIKGQGSADEKIAEAIARGRAYLDEGAALVFVPGVLDRQLTERLVEGIGERKVSVIGLPGALSAAEYEELGVARISYGPLPQAAALVALRDLALDLLADGVVDPGMPRLN